MLRPREGTEVAPLELPGCKDTSNNSVALHPLLSFRRQTSPRQQTNGNVPAGPSHRPDGRQR